MCSSSRPTVPPPKPIVVNDEPDITLESEAHNSETKKRKSAGTRSLQIPLTGTRSGSGVGVPNGRR
jgi:hypothetical protein